MTRQDGERKRMAGQENKEKEVRMAPLVPWGAGNEKETMVANGSTNRRTNRPVDSV